MAITKQQVEKSKELVGQLRVVYRDMSEFVIELAKQDINLDFLNESDENTAAFSRHVKGWLSTHRSLCFALHEAEEANHNFVEFYGKEQLGGV